MPPASLPSSWVSLASPRRGGWARSRTGPRGRAAPSGSPSPPPTSPTRGWPSPTCSSPWVTVTLALLVSGRLEWAGVAAGLAASAKYPGPSCSCRWSSQGSARGAGSRGLRAGGRGLPRHQPLRRPPRRRRLGRLPARPAARSGGLARLRGRSGGTARLRGEALGDPGAGRAGRCGRRPDRAPHARHGRSRAALVRGRVRALVAAVRGALRPYVLPARARPRGPRGPRPTARRGRAGRGDRSALVVDRGRTLADRP